jgi:hypothetical protein
MSQFLLVYGVFVVGMFLLSHASGIFEKVL